MEQVDFDAQIEGARVRASRVWNHLREGFVEELRSITAGVPPSVHPGALGDPPDEGQVRYLALRLRALADLAEASLPATVALGGLRVEQHMRDRRREYADAAVPSGAVHAQQPGQVYPMATPAPSSPKVP